MFPMSVIVGSINFVESEGTPAALDPEHAQSDQEKLPSEKKPGADPDPGGQQWEYSVRDIPCSQSWV